MSKTAVHLSSPYDLEDLHGAGDDVLHGVLADATEEDGGDFSQSGRVRGHGGLSRERGP